jgi:protein involved in polysaccharide export with SLBB domain
MTMRDLVLLAGGLDEGAYLKEAEIARLPENRTESTTATTIRVPLDSTYVFDRKPGDAYQRAPGLAALSDGAPEALLKPYDNVLILQQPSWELQRVVTIAGEVRFPGQYALKSRDERLSDLIDRAGGVTAEAYPEGTLFIRSKDHVGRVAIDVPHALKHRDSPENLLLIDGDRIMVPLKSYVVTVRGSVNAPNVVAFVPGKDIDYYINQAGGAGRNADPGRAFITQPSGKRETKGRFSSPKPQPGSLVIVPPHDPSTDRNWLGIISTLSQTTTTLIALYFALKTFKP